MPTRTRLRQLAASVLLVWLFVLGCGIANACVIAAELRHAAHAAATVDSGGPESATDDLAVPDCNDQNHADDHGQLPCERLWSDAAAAPQADKPQVSPLTGLWLAPAPLPSFQFKPPALLRAGIATGDPRLPLAVPIPIGLLRLAL
jgi:hypothetical protein